MSDRKIHPLAQLRTDMKNALPTFGLPDERSQERTLSVLMVAVDKDPSLVHADRASLISAVRQCSSHGLMPDGNEATLQVYSTKVTVDGKEHWIKKVQYQPMVRGIVTRVQNSGKVTAFWAEMVYEGEAFSIDISRGDRRPVHSPDFFSRSSKPLGVYAVAQMANGSVDCEVMTAEQIQKVRAVAKTKKVWDAWFEEKAKVAVLRRLSKRLPLSADDLMMIMNDDEHDLNQSTAPERPVKRTLGQRMAEMGAAGKEAPSGDQGDLEGDIVDAEVVQPHEYDEDAVDPFSDEYESGVKAFQNGSSDCPHEPNTLEHNNWMGGWLFAQKGSQAGEGK